MSPLWKDGDKWLNATGTAAMLSVSRNSLKALMNRPFDPLPRAFPFGRSQRWLASEVWGWMERQMNMASSIGHQDCFGNSVATEAEEHVQSVVHPHLWVSHLKEEYESGTTLDVLCRRHKIGKARLSELLRGAGAAMRAPGRRRESSNQALTGNSCQGGSHAR